MQVGTRHGLIGPLSSEDVVTKEDTPGPGSTSGKEGKNLGSLVTDGERDETPVG